MTDYPDADNAATNDPDRKLSMNPRPGVEISTQIRFIIKRSPDGGTDPIDLNRIDAINLANDILDLIDPKRRITHSLTTLNRLLNEPPEDQQPRTGGIVIDPRQFTRTPIA